MIFTVLLLYERVFANFMHLALSFKFHRAFQHPSPNYNFPFRSYPLSSVIDSTYVNTKTSCWYECSKKNGLCSFCGEGGYCCKTGLTGCPANVMTQATASSQCIMPYVNTKVTCWDRCSKKTGLCSFCGAFGYCCKTGATGCEGNLMTLATASSECIAPKGLGGISNLFSITTS